MNHGRCTERERGPPGPRGLPGASGGSTGPTGPVGPTGVSIGFTGLTGGTGNPGQTGGIGQTGPTGAGFSGQTGQTGFSGQTGQTGSVGPTGPTGGSFGNNGFAALFGVNQGITNGTSFVSSNYGGDFSTSTPFYTDGHFSGGAYTVPNTGRYCVNINFVMLAVPPLPTTGGSVLVSVISTSPNFFWQTVGFLPAGVTSGTVLVPLVFNQDIALNSGSSVTLEITNNTGVLISTNGASETQCLWSMHQIA